MLPSSQLSANPTHFVRSKVDSSFDPYPHKDNMNLNLEALITVPQAIEYQTEQYGRAIYKRDALYAAARDGRLPVVRHGKRRLYIPLKNLLALLVVQAKPPGEQ